MIQITKHFHLDEFAQHAGHGFDAQRYPLEWVEERLHPLCELLEAIRYELDNRQITITSGYRCPGYNRAIGGAASSQHVAGRAADFVVAGVAPADVHAAILRCYRAGFLPRLGGLGDYPRFTHVDIRPHKKLARWKGARL